MLPASCRWQPDALVNCGDSRSVSRWNLHYWLCQVVKLFSPFHCPDLQRWLSLLDMKSEHLVVGHIKDDGAIWQWHLSPPSRQVWVEGFGWQKIHSTSLTVLGLPPCPRSWLHLQGATQVKEGDTPQSGAPSWDATDRRELNVPARI